MEVLQFEELQVEFMRRIQQAVYCNVATVDRLNRPRSRVMHLVWDGPTGWGITSPRSHKARHLLANPAVSLAYVAAPFQPVYVDCTAAWVDTAAEKQRIWELHQNTPAPLGFDPAPYYGSIDNPLYGLLCFTPWRVELGDLHDEARIWRP